MKIILALIFLIPLAGYDSEGSSSGSGLHGIEFENITLIS